MKKLTLIVLVGALTLSGCGVLDAIDEQYRISHPDLVLAGPSGNLTGYTCDDKCQAEARARAVADWEKESNYHYVRARQRDDQYEYEVDLDAFDAGSKKVKVTTPHKYDGREYQIKINGKTLTCRPGVDMGNYVKGYNPNIDCR